MSKLRSRRVATALLAPLAALAVWGLFRAVGVTFHVSTGNGRVGAGDVVFGATAAGLLGWLVVRWLEKHVRRPRTWWVRVGSTCLAASMAGPSWLADGGSAVALMTLHLVTAIVIVVGFATTLPWRGPSSRYRGRLDDVPASSAA
jgi:Family of unknown function (DUF6069)